MFGMSGRKRFAGLFVLLLLMVVGGAVYFFHASESPGSSEPVAVPPDFVQAIEGMRGAVLAYDERHGYLPDVVSPDWVLEDDGTYADAKKFFVEATGGGKLAVSVVTNSEKTTRLIGVFSGDLMSDEAFRRNLARAAASDFEPGLYGVDNTPYKADGVAVYLRMEKAGTKR